MTESPLQQEFRSALAAWWTAPPAPSQPSGDGPWQALTIQMRELPQAELTRVILDRLSVPNTAKGGSQNADGLATSEPDGERADWDDEDRRAAEPTGAVQWQALKRRSLLEAWVQSAARDRSLDGAAEAGEESGWPTILERIEQWYRELRPDSPERCYLLSWLAWGPAPALALWVRLLREAPPVTEVGIRDFFAPLLRRRSVEAGWLFPDLLDAIGQLDLATAVLDLANFYYRDRQVRPHPASPRLGTLSQLLADLTQQLLRLEAAPLQAGIPVDQVSRVINDAVGLISALCDFLALHGDPGVVGKLYPCLEVRHRRVQLEAAYALATLDQEAGRERLIELAAEPLVRRRVLAYSEPLGLLDKIAPEFRTAAAAAESELVLSLAHPQNLGLAPKSTILLDQRQQFWPGFDQPLDCYLFQFEYPFTDHPYRNVGIVGPVTHSFSQPLNDLSVDDLYAVFAGWHVSHPEIYAVSRDDFGPHLAGTVARLERRLHERGLESIEPQLLGHCLGNWILVARGTREGHPGWGLTDADEPLWLPDSGGFAHLDAGLAWYFWLGRTLLKQFNSPSEA